MRRCEEERGSCWISLGANSHKDQIIVELEEVNLLLE
jgi:hypothetical protein